MNDQQRLENLLGALDQADQQASDTEILEEAQAAGIDTKAQAESMRAALLMAIEDHQRLNPNAHRRLVAVSEDLAGAEFERVIIEESRANVTGAFDLKKVMVPVATAPVNYSEADMQTLRQIVAEGLAAQVKEMSDFMLRYNAELAVPCTETDSPKKCEGCSLDPCLKKVYWQAHKRDMELEKDAEQFQEEYSYADEYGEDEEDEYGEDEEDEYGEDEEEEDPPTLREMDEVDPPSLRGIS